MPWETTDAKLAASLLLSVDKVLFQYRTLLGDCKPTEDAGGQDLWLLLAAGLVIIFVIFHSMGVLI